MEKMEGFAKLLRVEEARRIALKECARIKPRGEVVPIEDACGKVLAEDISAQYDVPAFDRSAVDGYAIRSEETFSASQYNPAIFRVAGISEAGGGVKRIGFKEAIEIYTGAPIPEGADAVAMAEDCSRKGEFVHVLKPVPKYGNVSRKGEDIKKGDLVFRKGRKLMAWDIAVLASIRMREVAVRSGPSIAVLSTGTELVDVHEPPALDASRVVDATRPMIKTLLSDLGCRVLDAGIVPDDVDEIRGRLSRLSEEADMLITIGGTSVGRKDLVPDAIAASRESKILFHGIAAKPGKPLGFGIFLGKPIFMLPGYPVSALVGYERVVQPTICALIGKPDPVAIRKKARAKISRRVPTTPGTMHFLRVTLRREGEVLIAEPITLTGSGLLSSITKADGIVVLGEDREGIDEGEEVEVELLGDHLE